MVSLSKFPILGISLFLFFLTSILGCASTPKQDFHNYLLQVSHSEAEDNEMANTKQQVERELSGTSTPSSQTIRSKLLPNLKRLLQQRENAKSQTPEVKELQRLEIATEKAFYTGFSLLADGIDRRDKATLDQAMQQITLGYSQAALMKAKKDQLIAKYGLPSSLKG
jgi:hypothetical protein